VQLWVLAVRAVGVEDVGEQRWTFAGSTLIYNSPVREKILFRVAYRFRAEGRRRLFDDVVIFGGAALQCLENAWKMIPG
jgi:hypothetical protein